MTTPHGDSRASTATSDGAIARGRQILVTHDPDSGTSTEARPAPSSVPPVTVVITWNVVQGSEAGFEEWAHGITEAGRRYPGHLGSNRFRLGRNASRYRTVIKFADDASLRGWMESEERRDWLRRVEGYTRRSEEHLTGMETWFTLPGAA